MFRRKFNFDIISQEEAKKIIDKKSGYQIIDARREDEYNSGHIPNSICIPHDSIDESIKDILPDYNQLLLVYCRSGNRSKMACDKLYALGYTNIKEFGGINTWIYEIEK